MLNMVTKIYWVQAVTLLGGTVFAWTTVIVEFIRFYNTEGTIFKISDCAYPNPVTTACFYGAIAFAVAFVWAFKLLKKDDDTRRKSEKRLMLFLIAGAVFAWTNFGRLVYDFYTALPGQGIGCSGVPAESPFATACFYGAMLFLTALIVSIVIIYKDRQSTSQSS